MIKQMRSVSLTFKYSIQLPPHVHQVDNSYSVLQQRTTLTSMNLHCPFKLRTSYRSIPSNHAKKACLSTLNVILKLSSHLLLSKDPTAPHFLSESKSALIIFL